MRKASVQQAAYYRTNYASRSALDEKLAQWLEALAGLRGRRPIPTLRSAALIVVDVQRIFADESSRAYLPAWDAAERRTQKLVCAFAEAKAPIIFSRHVLNEGEDGGAGERFYGTRPILSGDPLSELYLDAETLAKGTIWRKKTAACFALGVPAELSGVDSAVICGAQTQRCVLATAIDLPRLCVQPVVAADACAAPNEELHLSALRSLAASCAYVAGTEEIISALKEGRE